MGYIGSSKSIGAVSAEDEGKFPLTVATKEIKEKYGVNINKEWIKSEIRPCEWHHTGMYFKETDYYDITGIYGEYLVQKESGEYESKVKEFRQKKKNFKGDSHKVWLITEYESEWVKGPWNYGRPRGGSWKWSVEFELIISKVMKKTDKFYVFENGKRKKIGNVKKVRSIEVVDIMEKRIYLGIYTGKTSRKLIVTNIEIRKFKYEEIKKYIEELVMVIEVDFPEHLKSLLNNLIYRENLYKTGFEKNSEIKKLNKKTRSKWNKRCKTQQLTEDILERNMHKLNWNIVSEYQKMSKDFVIRHIDKIDIMSLRNNRYLDFNVNEKELNLLKNM